MDPFLFFHKVSDGHVNIGGRWSPLSIRDQMIRGRWAVERALSVLGGDRSLAVIGAGIGGVTAAMTAVDAGVRTTLFEKEHEPFSRHQACQRWVDPTQYDWPLDHYSSGLIPWPATPAVKLSWHAGRASAFVGNWRAEFNTVRMSANAGQYFTWRNDSEVVNVRFDSKIKMVDVEWRPAGDSTTRTDSYGLVITAMGFGDERSFLEYPVGHRPPMHPFRGYPFWSNDPFELPRLNRTPGAKRPRVLISGGGDGALQDFLRIATRFKSAVELWNDLQLPQKVRADIQKQAQDIDDQANRSLVWFEHSGPDHIVLDRLMQDYRSLADSIYNRTSVPGRLSRAIRSDDFEALWLVHPCTHFNQAYGLNRLLSLLLIRQLRKSGKFEHMPGWRLVEVRCNHVAGPADPQTCHGQPHLASFWPKHRCDRDPKGTFPPPPPLPPPGQPDQRDHEFDVLVVRHGATPPPQLWSSSSALTLPPTRQLLPYHYPG